MSLGCWQPFLLKNSYSMPQGWIFRCQKWLTSLCMCEVQNGFHGFVQKHQCDQLCTAITCAVFTASNTQIRPTGTPPPQKKKLLSDYINLIQPDGRLLKPHTIVNKTNVFIHTAQSSQRNGDARWMIWLRLWVAEPVSVYFYFTNKEHITMQTPHISTCCQVTEHNWSACTVMCCKIQLSLNII
jgi:hypothetical protein